MEIQKLHKNRPKTNRKTLFSEFGILVAFILLTIFFTILNPKFASITNILNMGRQISTIGIIAIGMTFLIIGGNFDLSVGSMFALVSTISAVMMVNGVSVILALLLGILLGGLLGLVNGVLSTFGRIPSFVVGLGMLNVYRGAQLLITGAYPVVVGWVVDDPGIELFAFLGKGKLFGVIPMQLVLLLILWGIGYFILTKTVFGVWTFAVGGSPQAAKIAGISIGWVQTFGFVITGVLVAVSSLLQLSFIGSVSGQVGTGYELDCIAAVIIGGTKLDGGEGTLIGTFIGAAVMGAMRNGLVLLNVSAFWQTLIIGLVIILAVAIDKWTKKTN